MTEAYCPKSNANTGFTIIELLVALAIMSIVVGAIVTSKIGQQSQSMSQQQAVEMQQTVRAAMSIMVKEIRMAGYNPYSFNYGAGITSAGANAITFSYVIDFDGRDNDGDTVIDETGEIETVSYRLQSKELQVNKGSGFTVLAENIERLNFEYFDQNGTSLGSTPASLLNIRAMRIILSSTTDANEHAYSTGTYISDNDNIDNDGDGNIDEAGELENNNIRNLVVIVKCRNLGM